MKRAKNIKSTIQLSSFIGVLWHFKTVQVCRRYQIQEKERKKEVRGFQVRWSHCGGKLRTVRMLWNNTNQSNQKVLTNKMIISWVIQQQRFGAETNHWPRFISSKASLTRSSVMLWVMNSSTITFLSRYALTISDTPSLPLNPETNKAGASPDTNPFNDKAVSMTERHGGPSPQGCRNLREQRTAKQKVETRCRFQPSLMGLRL